MRLTLLTFIFAYFASAFAIIDLPNENSLAARNSLDDAIFIRSDVGSTSLEARKSKDPGGLGDDVSGVGDDVGGAISDGITFFLAQIAQDKSAREQFTANAIGQAAFVRYPQYNWVICHTAHSVQFDGVQGTDWGQQHYEFDVKVGGTIGYEIYWFLSGNFTLEGKAGGENWAYYGNLKATSNEGKSLLFANRNNPLPPPSGALSSVSMAKGFFYAVPVLFIVFFCL